MGKKASTAPSGGSGSAVATSSTVTFQDIIIPSKGRANSQRATWRLLMDDRVPFTVVVEPQDEAAYIAALGATASEVAGPKAGKARHPRYRVVALDKNDQGVAYARNFILDNVAPKSGWFWIMDDDIRVFGHTEGRRVVNMSAKAMLQEVSRRMSMCIHLDHLGLFSLEYSQFSFSYDSDDAICVNSYANIAVCMNRDRMPEGLRYRLRVREDYDFVLQMLKAGFCTVRFRNLSFAVPVMGTKNGGMTPYYERQKADIRRQNRLFLEAWGHISEEVEKGAGASKRYDIKVRWSALSDITEAVALLNSVPFTGFSEDPLATTLKSPSSTAATSAAVKKQKSSAQLAPLTTVGDAAAERRAFVAEEEARHAAFRKLRKRERDEVLQTIRLEPPLAKEVKQPAAERRPRWQGWVEARYRFVDPAALAEYGLSTVPTPAVGHVVAFIPQNPKQPVLLEGTVINTWASNRGGRSSIMFTVVPARRGEQVAHCEHVFQVPADMKSVIEGLSGYYAD
jgi:hypothetical protein